MRDLNLTVPDYPYGSPCWVDLLVSDVRRAKSFYGELFGWQWLAGDPATGGYTMALLDGHPVAGISRKPDDAPVPSQWTTYLRVGDIDGRRARHQHVRRPHARAARRHRRPLAGPSSPSTPGAATSASGSRATCPAAASSTSRGR